MPKPTRPQPKTPPARRIPGRYKAESSDFVVEEVPAYAPEGSGDHLFLWVEKTGLSTLDAVARLAQELGRRQRDFGIAGMKDAHAIARQWISIEGVAPERVHGMALPGVVVLDARLHKNKLKLGHLSGNRFVILVEGAGAEHAEAARAVLAELAARGVPNYFGEQRFGKRGANLDKGLAILRGNPKRAARTMPRRLLSLVVSAVQSEVFNRVLVQRLGDCDQVRAGDVAWIHRNGACFAVVDAAAERARCDSFEISPSGPLPGPKTLWATAAPGELERAALSELEVDPDLFAKMPHGTHEGARRPLRVPVHEPQVAVEPRGLRVSFSLPRGAYATSVLRELLADVPWFG